MKDFESNRTQIMNSIENRVRQAYNSGYETGFEDGKINIYGGKEKRLEELMESLQKANATNATLIKLLEGKQEPCDDCVSRQEAIHCVTETELYNETFAEAKMRIAELKPVLPKHESEE